MNFFENTRKEAESKNSVGLVVDFKAGDKKYTSKQNFTMRECHTAFRALCVCKIT